MSFLTPWFLAGIALVAGPIIAHLIRRATRQRVPFSTLRFLEESPPVLTRRNRIQHPWLLLLRCLIVAALAAGFARPYLRFHVPTLENAGTPQNIVAVLDVSASMQRAGLWDAAKKKISDLAGGLKVQDQFVLLSVGDSVTELISREQWKKTAAAERPALVRAVLQPLTAGWGVTRLDTAFENAINQWEQMTEAADTSAQRKLVVVSDFAEGSHVAGLAGLSWPPRAEVDLEQVNPDQKGNAGLQWLGWAADTGSGPAVRVRVFQNHDNASSSLQLQLYDAKTNRALGAPEDLKVPADDAEVALVPVPANTSGPWRLELKGDNEPYDNTVWLVRMPPRDVNLTYYGAHDANDLKHARYYLERATAGWKDPVVKLTLGDMTKPTAPAAPPQPGAPKEVIIVAAPLSAEVAASVRARLEAGAFAIVLLNEPAMVDTAAALAGETGWKSLSTARSDALIGQVDFQHPLFSLFADPRYSDFSHIRFWQPQSVSLPAGSKVAVVARFDDASPAILEATVGQGREVVWGGDWAPVAGQWVLSTKFVPWLQSFFERAVGGAARPTVAEVSEAAHLVDSAGAQWRTALDAGAAWQGQPPTQPGLYQIQEGDSTREVALQVPSAESRINLISLDSFEKMGVPLHPGATGAAPAASAAPAVAQNELAPALENRQKLWRWLLVTVAAILALESLYSLVLARREAQPLSGPAA